MTRQHRRAFLGAVDRLVTKILQTETNWEGRWAAFCACTQNWYQMGAQQFNASQQEIVKELGGPLARRVINALGNPPVDDLYQALLYFGSEDPGHKNASLAWQRAHSDAMLVLQDQYPGLGLQSADSEDSGGNFAKPSPRAPDGSYMVNLHQTLWIISSGERTSKTIALTKMLQTLAGWYSIGWLIGALEPEAPMDHPETLPIEVAAAFLKGDLKPANAEAELAVQDLVDEMSREIGQALDMLYVLAGRRPPEAAPELHP